MALLTCDKVSLGYDGRKVAENISFQVNSGDYLCIVGENGSGKSTLMKTLLGLIPPVSGSIIYADGLKKNEIGYLPQQTMVQSDFPASVREIVQSGCINKCGIRPFFNKAEKKMAKDNMERMGISDLERKSFCELSGGQQQRVLLARALCATEKVLLLDEPVAGLDPRVTADMYELIKRLNDEGITIIMISHDLASAVNYATHILHINQGSMFWGTKQEYLKSTFVTDLAAEEKEDK